MDTLDENTLELFDHWAGERLQLGKILPNVQLKSGWQANDVYVVSSATIIAFNWRNSALLYFLFTDCNLR